MGPEKFIYMMPSLMVTKNKVAIVVAIFLSINIKAPLKYRLPYIQCDNSYQ
jgi:hypothetical protein